MTPHSNFPRVLPRPAGCNRPEDDLCRALQGVVDVDHGRAASGAIVQVTGQSLSADKLKLQVESAHMKSSLMMR